jgi:hypothetical protein
MSAMPARNTTNSSPPKRATVSARAHDAAQPVGDRGQQPVSDRMAERVVDLLELVEIDEQHRAAVESARRAQRAVELIMEERAVRQPGHGIEARHVADLGFGGLSLGDVLDDQDGTAVLHHLDGEFERAVALRLDRGVGVAAAGNVVPEMRCHARRIALRQRADGDAVLQQIADRGVGCDQIARDAEQFGEAAVRDRDAALAVAHAQAVRHVVERGVEPARQQRDLVRRDGGLEVGLVQAGGDAVQPEEEQRDQDADRRIVGIVLQHSPSASGAQAASSVERTM